MKNYRLQTTEGVRDYLGDEAYLKKKIEIKVLDFLYRYGYEPVKTPTFEYVDVFATDETSQQPDLYTLINHQGEFLALRNDMTSAIARVVATKDHTSLFPKKYCYVENTFRYPVRYQGKSHEFTQAGIEFIGSKDIQSDVEVIKIAIQCLKSFHLSSFAVHVGDSQFLKTLFQDLKLSQQEQEVLQDYIERKDFVSFKSFLKKTNLPKDLVDSIINLMLSAGKISYLNQVKEQFKEYSCSKCLNHLFEFYDLLKLLHLEQYIVFDFSINSYGRYYTGIIFQIFTLGLTRPIVSGGRYDDLLKEFGLDVPAIGFGLDVDGLIELLKTEQKQEKRYLSIVLDDSILFSEEENQKRRAHHEVIHESIFKTVEETIAYGKEKKYDGVLVYQNQNVTLIQLDGEDQ